MQAAGRIGRRCLPGVIVAGCAPPPVRPVAAGPATAWLVSLGWHTEIVFDWPPGQAPRTPFPSARRLGVSFGARDFFTAPDPGPLELAAAMIPGEAVILVAPRAGPGADAVGIAIPDAPRRLAEFVNRDILHGASGHPVAAAPGFTEGAVFLLAARRYSPAYTCNTWALDALGAAGLPVRGDGIVTAGAAMAAARRAVAAAPG